MVWSCLQNVREGISPTDLIMGFGTETHSAVQPQTENLSSLDGAKQEAASSYASYTRPVPEKEVQWSCITPFLEGGRNWHWADTWFFSLWLHYFQIYMNKRQRDTIRWLLTSTECCDSGWNNCNACIQMSRRGCFPVVCWRGRNLLELLPCWLYLLWTRDSGAGACSCNKSPCDGQATWVCTLLHCAKLLCNGGQVLFYHAAF